MPKRESKYDLTSFAYLKVPRSIYDKIVKHWGKDKWTEAARDILWEHLDRLEDGKP